MRKEHDEDQAHIFQDTYFKNSQIYLLTVMNYFEHTNHEVFPIIHIFVRVKTFSQQ